MNLCSKIEVSTGGMECGKQVKQQQHLQAMEVPHVGALAHVPAGVIGVVSADIEALGLAAAISLAAQKQGIDIQFIDSRPKPPELKIIDHMRTFNIEPTIKKVKSSKGKITYGGNYTPPKKKRKKR